MTQIAAAVFFLGLIAVLGVVLQHLVRDHLPEILAALRGQHQPRRPVIAAAKSAVPMTRRRPAAA